MIARDHAQCATPDHGGCQLGDPCCPIASTPGAAPAPDRFDDEPMPRLLLKELDARNRISLAGVRKLHDRYRVEVSDDGTIVLTPVDVTVTPVILR